MEVRGAFVRNGHEHLRGSHSRVFGIGVLRSHVP